MYCDKNTNGRVFDRNVFTEEKIARWADEFAAATETVIKNSKTAFNNFQLKKLLTA